MTVNQVLDEREGRYGSFRKHAQIAQDLKGVLMACPKWGGLSPSQKEALEMICHKMARVMNGDPNYVDNWTDIAGYAVLVERELGGVCGGR